MGGVVLKGMTIVVFGRINNKQIKTIGNRAFTQAEW